jgi:pilin/secretion family protein with methylation motif
MKRFSYLSCRRVYRAISGLSLAELIVSLALFSIVMAGVATLIRETVRYYNANLVGIDVQRESILAMNRVRNDLSDASFSSFRTEVSGFVLGNPRNADGDFVYDEDSGALMWHQLICYYTEKRQGVWLLIRVEYFLEEPSVGPPEITSDYSVNYFKSAAALKPKIVARHIETLACSRQNPTNVSLRANYGDGAFALNLKTSIYLAK